MSKMKKILDYINAESSPIRLRSNMLLSAPFVGRKNGELKYCVFTYSVGRVNEAGNRFHFSEIFYFDRRDCSMYERYEIDSMSVEKAGRCFPEELAFSYDECPIEQLYNNIVDLTDAILDNKESRKENARLYMMHFNKKYNEAIQKVYMLYGNEFFRWIADLANE